MDVRIMPVWTREINTNYNFQNIDIINVYKDGTLSRYEVVPHSGYVMYNTNANDVEIDPETYEEIPVIYYCRLAGLPLTYNFASFSYVAVLESEVDPDYIFGNPEPDHETA